VPYFVFSKNKQHTNARTLNRINQSFCGGGHLRMDNRTTVLLGYWLDAIGQTMSAVANTPMAIKNESSATDLDLWGNVLQGTGTALTSVNEPPFSLDELGNQLESIGNLVTVTGIIAPINDELKVSLEHKGDIIETLGVAVALPEALQEGFTMEIFFDIFGHFLQVIEFKDIDEGLVNMISEWSQAIAAILALIDVIQDDIEA